MIDLLLNPPITLSDVNHFVGRETMLQQSTCEGMIESVEQSVGRDEWFLISMPHLVQRVILIKIGVKEKRKNVNVYINIFAIKLLCMRELMRNNLFKLRIS